MNNLNTYTCKKCGKAAIVTPSKTIKACTCDAPIIASIKVSLKGAAKVNGR